MIKCSQDLFGHVRIFFNFLLFKLLKLKGSEDARSYMTLVQNMPCGLGLKNDFNKRWTKKPKADPIRVKRLNKL